MASTKSVLAGNMYYVDMLYRKYECAAVFWTSSPETTSFLQ